MHVTFCHIHTCILCTMGNKPLFTMYEMHVPLSFWFLQTTFRTVQGSGIILVDLQRSRLYLLPVLFHVFLVKQID